MIIILAALLIISSCSNITKTDENSTADETNDLIEQTVEGTGTDAPEPTPESTPEATAEPMEFISLDSAAERSLNGLIKKQDIPDETTQLIVVAVDGNYDKMYLMEKQNSGMWQVVYGPFDVQLGKNGLGKEAEGDGKSPEGLYELGYAFGEDPAPTGAVWPWRTSEDGDIWIEDVNSKYYNMYVKDDGSIEDADWKTYSNLNIAAFARAVEIRYNADRVAGAGSAIFLHIWLSPKKDTNGCTAISRENIETLIKWLDPAQKTMIFQTSHKLIGNGDLVYVSDFSADIKADIKFAQDDNFFGMPLEGYNDNQIITKVDVAQALVKASQMLQNYDTRLVVYEAYRPESAFYQIRDWLNDPEDNANQEEYYKDIDKQVLMEEYFSYDSDRLYLRSQVVHVSLIDIYGETLDMGSEYMVFDEYTSYVCEGLTPEQIYNRELLHDIMLQAGFTSVDNQWWKFEYNPYLYDVKFNETIE